MNKTLRLLAISDIFVISGFGLIAPILAIFINDNLIGGGIFAAGFASTVFLLTHAILQVVFSYVYNPPDRIWILRLGTFLIFLVPFGYIFATHVGHIYIVEFIYGLGAAFAYPSWSSLFTAHLEKGKRGFQYSIYNSSVCAGTAITAAIGAWLAEKIGFQYVFAITGLFALFGLFTLFRLEKKALKKI